MKRAIFVLALVFVLIGTVLVLVYLLPGAAMPEPAPLSSHPLLSDGVALAPSDLDRLLLIPSPRALYATFKRHPLTEASLAEWSASNRIAMLQPLLGDAPALAWRRNGEWTVATAASGWKRPAIVMAGRLIVRNSVRNSVRNGRDSSSAVRSVGRWTVLGPQSAASGLAHLSSLAQGLRGNLYFYAPGGGKSLLSPSGEGLFGAVTVLNQSITARTRALAHDRRLMRNVPIDFPADAIFSLKVAESPEGVEGLERLLRAKITGLLDQGALLAVYRIDRGKLVPRPHGVVVVPTTAVEAQGLAESIESLLPEVKGEIGRLLGGKRRRERMTPGGVTITRVEGLGYTVETGFSNGELVVGFDKSSVEKYLAGRESGPSALSVEPMCWHLRTRGEALSDLRAVAGHEGLQIVAPRLAGRLGDVAKNASLFTAAKVVDVRSFSTETYDETAIEVLAK